MEAELLEIRRNLSKTFKNLLELDSSDNNNSPSFNNYQGQGYLNSNSSGNDLKLKNLNSSQGKLA
jgi:hypothetical protein